jgi:hypothetical protein
MQRSTRAVVSNAPCGWNAALSTSGAELARSARQQSEHPIQELVTRTCNWRTGLTFSRQQSSVRWSNGRHVHSMPPRLGLSTLRSKSAGEVATGEAAAPYRGMSSHDFTICSRSRARQFVTRSPLKQVNVVQFDPFDCTWPVLNRALMRTNHADRGDLGPFMAMQSDAPLKVGGGSGGFGMPGRYALVHTDIRDQSRSQFRLPTAWPDLIVAL